MTVGAATSDLGAKGNKGDKGAKAASGGRPSDGASKGADKGGLETAAGDARFLGNGSVKDAARGRLSVDSSAGVWAKASWSPQVKAKKLRRKI